MALADQLAQGIQFAPPPDPFAQYGKMQQLQQGQQANQLNQMKMAEYQRAADETNALRQLDRSSPDYVNQLYRISPTQGLAYEKSVAEAKNLASTGRKTEAEILNLGVTGKKTQSDIDKNKLDKQLRITEVASSVLRGVRDQATYDQAKRALSYLVPAESLADYPQAYDPGFVNAEIAMGQTLTQRLTSENAARVAATGEAGVAATLRGQNITAGTAAAGQQSQERIANLNRQQTLDLANRPVFNEAAQGFVGRPTTAAPSGTFTPMPAGQANKDQQAAVKALKSAGYDVATGEDNISKLIQKSTSGRLQAGAAATLAFFDLTTEGRKAISALEGTANQIATDLAGGKLGAGISNTDRDFIVGALGDVANPNKTSEERLAGWSAAKQRMVNTGLIPPPKFSAPNPSSSVSGEVTPAAGGNAPPPPPGFKPD
jgi:hypothetical protein